MPSRQRRGLRRAEAAETDRVGIGEPRGRGNFTGFPCRLAREQSRFALQNWIGAVLREIDSEWCGWQTQADVSPSTPSTPPRTLAGRALGAFSPRRPSEKRSAKRRRSPTKRHSPRSPASPSSAAVRALRAVSTVLPSPRSAYKRLTEKETEPKTPRMQALVRNVVHDHRRHTPSSARAPRPPSRAKANSQRFRRQKYVQAHDRHLSSLRGNAIRSIEALNQLSRRP